MPSGKPAAAKKPPPKRRRGKITAKKPTAPPYRRRPMSEEDANPCGALIDRKLEEFRRNTGGRLMPRPGYRKLIADIAASERRRLGDTSATWRDYCCNCKPLKAYRQCDCGDRPDPWSEHYDWNGRLL